MGIRGFQRYGVKTVYLFRIIIPVFFILLVTSPVKVSTGALVDADWLENNIKVADYS